MFGYATEDAIGLIWFGGVIIAAICLVVYLIQGAWKDRVDDDVVFGICAGGLMWPLVAFVAIISSPYWVTRLIKGWVEKATPVKGAANVDY